VTQAQPIQWNQERDRFEVVGPPIIDLDPICRLTALCVSEPGLVAPSGSLPAPYTHWFSLGGYAWAIRTGGPEPLCLYEELPRNIGRVIFYSPTLWGQKDVKLDEDYPQRTGVYTADLIEVSLPGCARSVDDRYCLANIRPGGNLLVVYLDRWDLEYRKVAGLRQVFAYGDHHGQRFCGIWVITEDHWVFEVETYGYKRRGVRLLALEGDNFLDWQDLSRERVIDRAPIIG